MTHPRVHLSVGASFATVRSNPKPRQRRARTTSAGALPAHGAFADRCDRPGDAGRRHQCKVVTGIDDHSRFCVIAKLVLRVTARPVCDALLEGLARHRVPETDLDRQRQGFHRQIRPKPAIVAFDRVCLGNGIRHIWSASCSPTTTGKIERLRKTIRKELVSDRVFASIAQAQAEMDSWVDHYNLQREHQGIGDVHRSGVSSS